MTALLTALLMIWIVPTGAVAAVAMPAIVFRRYRVALWKALLG